MIDEKLALNFWLHEFLDSDTAVRLGINNLPDEIALNNLRLVLAPGAQRVRNALGYSVHISSGFRSPALNAAIPGSSKTSAHMTGRAMDFRCPEFGPPKRVAKYLVERSPDIRFHQLILEGTWVHIEFPPLNVPARYDVLTARFVNGTPTYLEGLV